MNEWVREMTVANGLIDRITAAPNEQHVALEFKAFVTHNFNEPAVLAGNSVHYDRSFIKQWWPEVYSLLHYRILDVSSFKIIMQNKYGLVFNKQESHRALDDIRESMAELKFYLEYFGHNGPSAG
jgi:oligoribonuclease